MSQGHDSHDDQEGISAEIQAVLEECLRRRAAGDVVQLDLVVRQHSRLMPQLGAELKKLSVIWKAEGRIAEPSHDTASMPGAGAGIVVLESSLGGDTRKSQYTPDAEGRRPSDRQLSSGDRVGPYHIVRVVGEGGYGTVYLAKDVELDRPVAIKVAKRRSEGEIEEIDSFLAEARRVAQLQHPSIVKILDVSRGDSSPWYLVMEYIEGPTLADSIAAKSLSVVLLVELIVQIADALHHAHRNGVLHRDLKPANVLLDRRERHAWIVDFGMALHEREQAYAPRRAAGTPYSMAPEQVRGETHRLDGRTDIWSLGVLMYEGLSGKRPFVGANVDELLRAIVHEDPEPLPLDLARSDELQRICCKCLAKRMSDRYPTAADVAADLRRWLAERLDSSDGFIASKPGLGGEDCSRAIVPKGLRSFGAEDAAFFPTLLPGPWGRDGLPESVSTWIRAIENADDRSDRAVLVLYGPSGSGKSSFMRAGVLPNLAAGIRTICIDSAVGDPERAILKSLGQVSADFAVCDSLEQACSLARKGRGLPLEQKILIVLDQFEQWLHANNSNLSGTLATALRQCDGTRLQCLLIVRSDFWLGITRFLHELEITLIEGVNSGHLDLFDMRHTRRVLAAFGQAYGCLPPTGEPLRDEHREFLEHAAVQLSTDEWVMPVRLALFAEMMKHNDWTTTALQRVGGERGLRVAYLEQVFDSPLAGPSHRRYRREAEAILRALLPASGVEIKAKFQTRQELQHASGLSGDDDRFHEVMDILNSQLRLITPAEDADAGSCGARNEASDASAAPTDQQSFQLTHDYLVPALQDWLTRNEKSTWRGCAELRLRECAAVWNARPERHYLPAWWEWLHIRLFTHPRQWTEQQATMMHKALQHYSIQSAIIAACSGLVVLIGWESVGKLRADALLDELKRAPTADVSKVVSEMTPYRRWIDAPLAQAYREAVSRADARTQLHASLGLLPVDSEQVSYLLGRLLAGSPPEVLAIRSALEPHAGDCCEQLWTVLSDDEAAPHQRLRAACFLAGFAPDDNRWRNVRGDLAAILADESPMLRKDWVNALQPVSRTLLRELAPLIAESHGHLNQRALINLYVECAEHASDGYRPLEQLLNQSPGDAADHELEGIHQQAAIVTTLAAGGRWEHVWPHLRHAPNPTFRTELIAKMGDGIAPVGAMINRLVRSEEADPACRQALLLVIGDLSEKNLSIAERERLLPFILSIYEDDAAAGVHASARWLLQQWGRQDKIEAIDDRLATGSPEGGRQWFVNRQGQTMVVIPPGQTDLRVPSGEARTLRNVNTIAFGWQEVTAADFLCFRPEHEVDPRTTESNDCPVNLVSWYDAAAYCNWLSREEGIAEAEWCYLPNSEGKYAAGMKIKANSTNLRGYRLPTLEEWEYGCCAGSASQWSVGDEAEMLDRYAWSITNAAMRTHPARSLRPNDFGLFDMCGNVWEWTQTPADEHGNERSHNPAAEQIVEDATDRVLRGGTYLNDAIGVSLANLNGNPPYERTGADGFRVARTLRR